MDTYDRIIREYCCSIDRYFKYKQYELNQYYDVFIGKDMSSYGIIKRDIERFKYSIIKRYMKANKIVDYSYTLKLQDFKEPNKNKRMYDLSCLNIPQYFVPARQCGKSIFSRILREVNDYE